jgi:phenylalanyl-tRNA synthetase alpha chain
MKSKLEKLKTEALLAIKAAKDSSELENLQNKLLGRKSGELTGIMRGLKELADDVRKDVGSLANSVRSEIEKRLQEKQFLFERETWEENIEKERVDVTQPYLPKKERGHFHPTTIIRNQIEDLFTSMGFTIVDGPELESDYYNFDALNFEPNHPARDTMDTFHIKDESNWVMRTHTSPNQVRALQKYGAPLRVIVPGKCFRNEATDTRHEHTLYQVEGIVIDKGITLGDLKGLLERVAKNLYGEETKLRVRPKHYPFVEPGINGEITCFLCKGVGCRVCKKSGWLEIFGAGMTHPNVLKEGGVDSKQYQGFAFGLGLDRLVMLKYGIEDIRLLESGNMKFLEQF